MVMRGMVRLQGEKEISKERINISRKSSNPAPRLRVPPILRPHLPSDIFRLVPLPHSTPDRKSISNRNLLLLPRHQIPTTFRFKTRSCQYSHDERSDQHSPIPGPIYREVGKVMNYSARLDSPVRPIQPKEMRRRKSSTMEGRYGGRWE